MKNKSRKKEILLGRPSSYGPEIIKKANEYLEEYEMFGDEIPSVPGLSNHIDRARSTIYKWRDEEGKEAFSDILEKINAAQCRVLINKGLTGEFNSQIAKLVLGKHGYGDIVQQELSGQGGGPVQLDWNVKYIRAKERKHGKDKD